ncbi:MAG: GHKL domain-containing protein [Acholeplasmataceae bacterium]|nr:MAG: GHKL domain-containing protein [Acholeplasmataceae bacterium]
MKKALIRNNIMLVILAFLLFLAVALFVLYRFQWKQQDTFMRMIMAEVELAYNNHDDDAAVFVLDYAGEHDRRITVLDPQFRVIADSHDDRVGTDKSSRPELVEPDTVKARYSTTVNLTMLYIAREMEDGNYLRISVPAATQTAAYNQLILWFSLTGLAFVLIYAGGLFKLNQNLLAPWEQAKKGMKALKEGRYQVMTTFHPYPEINEIIHEMNDISLDIARHVRNVERYQEQLSRVLNEIKQAVMLFNHQNILLYANKDARTLFDLDDEAIGNPAYHGIRSTEIKQAVTDVNQNRKESAFDYKKDGSVYEIRAFAVADKGSAHEDATVLLLCRDVTQSRAVEQMKRDFFSHASHELKSPLTAIRGYAELIEHKLVKQEEVEDTARQIVRQSETMTTLVEDMLMLSRLENIKETTYTRQRLDHLLEEVVITLKPISDHKNMTLSIQASDIEMMCDPLDLQKLFKNLIENAIKYSPADTLIDIQLHLDNDHIIFKVADQGLGIEPVHQQRVFERFYRVDKGRKEGGTGLGLAIVKHVVLKYQGKIDLQSKVNEGTTVTIKMKKNM